MSLSKAERGKQWWGTLSVEQRAEWYRKLKANPNNRTTRPRQKPAIYFRGIRVE